jgi:hypothetical protein
MKGKLCSAEQNQYCYTILPDKGIKNIQYNILSPPKYNRETKTASPARRVLQITLWYHPERRLYEGLEVPLRKLFIACLGRLWETKSPLISEKSQA